MSKFSDEHIVKNSLEISKIRKKGNSFSDKLLVLIIDKNEKEVSRLAVIASRSVGGAVQRNRCKRRLRARISKYFHQILDGYDLIFIARRALLLASPIDIDRAVLKVITKAGIVGTKRDGSG